MSPGSLCGACCLTGYPRYANCLLATLNARLVLRDGTDKNNVVAVWEDATSNVHSHSHSGQTSSSNNNNSNNNKQTNVIHIHTQVDTDIELRPYPSVSPPVFLNGGVFDLILIGFLG